jgi:shikimate dehydrogenase
MRDLTENQSRRVIGARVLILGAGGAARGILGPLLEARPKALVLANRTLERAATLSRELAAETPIEVCKFDELEKLGAFDIIVNATSAGLHGEQPPFPASLLSRATFCYDLAYSLKQTPFVAWAQAHGAGRAIQGWGMLVEQAAESFAIWRGIRPDTTAIRQQLLR